MQYLDAANTVFCRGDLLEAGVLPARVGPFCPGRGVQVFSGFAVIEKLRRRALG